MTRDPSRRDLADARDVSGPYFAPDRGAPGGIRLRRPPVLGFVSPGNPMVTTLRKTRPNTHAVALRALRPC